MVFGEKKIFDNYYEVEKIMQIHVQDRLHQAKQERLVSTA